MGETVTNLMERMGLESCFTEIMYLYSVPSVGIEALLMLLLNDRSLRIARIFFVVILISTHDSCMVIQISKRSSTLSNGSTTLESKEKRKRKQLQKEISSDLKPNHQNLRTT